MGDVETGRTPRFDTMIKGGEVVDPGAGLTGMLDVGIAGGKIAITEPGRPYVRIAAAAFDTYLAASQKKHSLVV